MKKIIFLLITLAVGCSSMRDGRYDRTPSSIEENRRETQQHGNYDRVR